MQRTIEGAMARLINGGPNFISVFGCDPGPVHSAIVRVNIRKRPDGRLGAFLVGAWYPENRNLKKLADAVWINFGMLSDSMGDSFLAIEKCGEQGCSPGEEVFETAAMYGEIRQLFRPMPTYALRSSEWRHALAGQGNARTPLVYAASKAFFDPTGGGADKYKGVAKQPGPLWQLHAAGAGGNVEHLKDALGAALGLAMIRFRSGVDPEAYRREW